MEELQALQVGYGWTTGAWVPAFAGMTEVLGWPRVYMKAGSFHGTPLPPRPGAARAYDGLWRPFDGGLEVPAFAGMTEVLGWQRVYMKAGSFHGRWVMETGA